METNQGKLELSAEFDGTTQVSSSVSIQGLNMEEVIVGLSLLCRNTIDDVLESSNTDTASKKSLKRELINLIMKDE